MFVEGRNRELVKVNSSWKISEAQFRNELLRREGPYRELVYINSSRSNFVRVLLGERALTVADIAARTFLQCSSSMVLVKIPMSAFYDLGLDPHRDIWLGRDSTPSGPHCYFNGRGPDLFHFLSIGKTGCGSEQRFIKKERLTYVYITVSVGSDQHYTFKRVCQIGLNSALIPVGSSVLAVSAWCGYSVAHSFSVAELEKSKNKTFKIIGNHTYRDKLLL